jgi:hypothetical protein
MIEFESIKEPQEFFQWLGEHCAGEVSMEEAAIRYNQALIDINDAMGGIPDGGFVMFRRGDIVDESGEWFETYVIIRAITRSEEPADQYQVVFVVDKDDQVVDVIYMPPGDPRVGAGNPKMH